MANESVETKLKTIQKRLVNYFDCDCSVTLNGDLIHVEIDDVSPFKADFKLTTFTEYYEGNVHDFYDMLISLYYNS